MPWLSAIVLLPLVGALSLLAVPAGPAGAVQARIHAILTAGTTAVLVAILIGLFDRRSGGLQYVDHAGWAEQVGLSKTPCWARVQAMEKEGVIRGYRAVVDPAALGLDLTAFIQVSIEFGSHAAFTASGA